MGKMKGRVGKPFEGKELRVLERLAERIADENGEFTIPRLFEASRGENYTLLHKYIRSRFGERLKGTAVSDSTSLIDIRVNPDGTAVNTKGGNIFILNENKTTRTDSEVEKLYIRKPKRSKRNNITEARKKPILVEDWFSTHESQFDGLRSFLESDNTLTDADRLIKLGREFMDKGQRIKKIASKSQL